MSELQMAVLRQLREAKWNGSPFIEISSIHHRTLRSLIEHDWVFESPGQDGVRYTITGRGEDALKVYEAPVKRRYDGICPNCGKRPKHINKNGKQIGYCKECDALHKRRQAALGRAQGDIHRTCSRCRKRPRKQFPGGKYSTYCDHCTRVTKRQWKRKYRKVLMARARRGELMCCICKVKPVVYTENSVYDYCREHLRAYMNSYNDRRRTESRAAKMRQALHQPARVNPSGDS